MVLAPGAQNDPHVGNVIAATRTFLRKVINSWCFRVSMKIPAEPTLRKAGDEVYCLHEGAIGISITGTILLVKFILGPKYGYDCVT